MSLAQSSAQDSRPNRATLHHGPIHFEGNANYLFRDRTTACQVVISDASHNPTRLVLAFPKGNSGFLTFFKPLNGDLSVTLAEGSIQSVEHADEQTGIAGALLVSGDLELGTTIIGSVRTLRDYLEGGGIQHPELDYTLGEYSTSSVQLVRRWLDGDTEQIFTLSTEDNATLRVTPSADGKHPGIRVERQDKTRHARLQFSATLDFVTTTPTTPDVGLVGLGGADLFRNSEANSATKAILDAIRNYSSDVVDQMSFLTYQDVFFAGGWRFLTYFGRDTLFTLQLLMPVLSEQAIEAVLAAVIQRTSPTGELCHEETVGDYASFEHRKEGKPELGNTPVYVYTMVDTDFLLLPILAQYLTSKEGSARAEPFLKRQSSLVPGSFESLLLRNIDHVLGLTQPFTNNPVKENLIGIRAFPVGNWRDSHAGLGWGTYPFDVNCAFIPAALEAIGSLADANIISAKYKAATAASKIWVQHACALFEVTMEAPEVHTKIDAYVKLAHLSDSLLDGAGSLKDTQSAPKGDGNGWNEATQTIGRNGPSIIYALSLMEDYTPVSILHSDLSFVLINSHTVPTSMIQATIEALQPYPRGLLTNVGMVVANAAYDRKASRIPEFSDAAYHGAVSWSWTQAMMAAGVARQLELCDSEHKPEWCDTHRAALEQAQTRLWDSIAGSKDVLWTEVWSPVFNKATGTFDIGDLGIKGDGTEGDAVQLWSYGFLGLVDPRTGKPVAAGIEAGKKH